MASPSSPASGKALAFQSALKTLEVPALDGGDFEHLTVSGQLALIEGYAPRRARASDRFEHGRLSRLLSTRARHPEVSRLVSARPCFRLRPALAGKNQSRGLPPRHRGPSAAFTAA